MEKVPGKDNTSMTEIANVLLEPDANREDILHYDAHFSGMDNGYQSEADIRSSRHKENLPFPEWTAKYHQ